MWGSLLFLAHAKGQMPTLGSKSAPRSSVSWYLLWFLWTKPGAYHLVPWLTFKVLLVLHWNTLTNHWPNFLLISIHGRQPPSAGFSFPDESKAPSKETSLWRDFALILQPHQGLQQATQILSQVCLMTPEEPGRRGGLLSSFHAPISLSFTRTFFNKKFNTTIAVYIQSNSSHFPFLSLYLSFNSRMVGNKLVRQGVERQVEVWRRLLRILEIYSKLNFQTREVREG